MHLRFMRRQSRLFVCLLPLHGFSRCLLSILKQVTKRRLILVLAVLLLTVAALGVVVTKLDEQGQKFFETGKQLVGSLDQIASAIRNKDVAAIGFFYSS